MKKYLFYFLAVILMGSISSCGVGHAYIFNLNQNETQVQLNRNNYRVVEQVSGSAEVSYVFLIGGINKRQLYQNAYAQMTKNANLAQGSRALINLVTEEHAGGFAPFFIKRTITVSANVIEFNE